MRENLEFPVPEVFRDFPSYGLDRLDETSVRNADAGFLAETPEKAPSMEIQAAMIREIFLNSEPLQFENWTMLSLDERVIALNQLEGDVAQISCRDALPVLAEQLPIRCCGYCNGEILVINQKQIMSNDYQDYRTMLDTFFHEGRHGYQFYNLNKNRVEPNQALLESWENNYLLESYRSFRLDFKNWGFRRYQEQPVEVDARAFAETVLNSLELEPLRQRKRGRI